jgi:hypothetical protein
MRKPESFGEKYRLIRVGRHVDERVRPEEARARDGDGAAVDVRGEHLQDEVLVDPARVLGEEDRQRVRLLARRAAGRPDADHAPRCPARKQRGQRLVERLEGPRISEERGDADQQVAEERLDLRGGLLEEADVVLQSGDLVHRHPPLDAAVHRVRLVLREVVARLRAQHHEHVVQGVPGCGGLLQNRQAAAEPADVGNQLRAHLPRRQHEVHAARGDGVLRHAVELRRLGQLGQHQPALCLHGEDAERAVAARAREDDADRQLLLRFSECAEEEVDGEAEPAVYRRFQQLQVAVEQGEVAPGRDDVHAVDADLHVLLRFEDLQVRQLRDELGEDALVLGREVLDQHERHSGELPGRKAREEGLERRESTRGCADADDWEPWCFAVVGGGLGLLPAASRLPCLHTPAPVAPLLLPRIGEHHESSCRGAKHRDRTVWPSQIQTSFCARPCR